MSSEGRAAVRRIGALVAAGWLLAAPLPARAQGQAQSEAPMPGPGPLTVALPACDERTPLPTRFRLEFAARAARGALSLDGENSLSFERDGERYTLTSDTRSLLYRARQVSTGTLQSGTLVPAQYTEQAQRRARQTTTLDWTARTVSFSATDAVAPTEPLMQDRLSLLLQLGLRLRVQPRIDELQIPAAGVRGTTTYRFRRVGAETLDLPPGRIATVKLERLAGERGDSLEVWLAPGLCWLPVRIRYTDEHGQTLHNELRSAHFD